MIHRPRLVLLALAATALLVLPASVGARTQDNPQLIATVGTAGSPEAYSIRLTDAAGNAVSQLDPGTYDITVHDYATLHNFHLFGAGVSESTDIVGTGDAKWTVTLANGVYQYQCDAHANVMHGSFRVGAPPPPKPKPVALAGKVGPGKAISLKRSSGARVTSLKAGKARVTVRDLSAKDNFHLIGPGTNAKTGVAFKGTKTWSLTLRKGTYRYRSDAHPALKGSFKVS
jgi:plastocyanin